MTKKKTTKTAAKLQEAKRASNYLQTARAKKTLGKSVKPGGIQVVRKKGEKPIPFRQGGLHKTLGISQDKKIPASELRAALAGKRGKLAQKQARFAKNILIGRRK